jgi:hypothetical protein
MSGKDRDVLNPGDLVRVNFTLTVNVNAIQAQLAGKIGAVVAEAPMRPSGRRAYKVLVDGRIRYFYGVDLEPVNEAR